MLAETKLTPAELRSAETDIIRQDQNEAFGDEIGALSKKHVHVQSLPYQQEFTLE